MATNVYAAKKALMDRLTVLAGVGQPLAGLQVAYAFPREPQLECVYGGGVRFDHVDAVAERGVLFTETALVSLYIRVVVKQPGVVETTDARAAEIFAQLAAALHAQPQLAGPMSFMGITQGQGDYDQTVDESLSILGLQVRIETDLTYGGG